MKGFEMVKLYTVAEAAKLLKCSTRKVYNEINRGNLKAYKRAGFIRISEEQLEGYLNNE